MEAVTHIKGYELKERIGSGGFGVVHRAYQTTIGREVAIKIIQPRLANQPDFIRCFEIEAQLIARLEHPFIVPLYDYWRDQDGAYLVMRWLRGGSLRDALQKSVFELDSAVMVLDQITSALAAAHRQNVIHRDIKPGNILLDEDGNAYLADFGIAKDYARTDQDKTATGMIKASPDYLSPEQARSELVTPQTDIYSLGVVVYEMLTSEHPFPNATAVERMYKHLNEPLPAITNLPDGICTDVNAVIQQATAKNPAHRYHDALEMAVAFRVAAGLDRAQAGASLIGQLTLREHEILQLIIGGCTNQEIAQQLVIAEATVKWHNTQLYRKLRVRNRVQAIVRARELNLITPDIAEELVAMGDTATYITLPEPENPYKGLRAFQTADARDFFGRERLTHTLIERMQEKDPLMRFLAVIGPSGSGKSSLVRAGLVPALWRGEIPGSDRWFVVEMMPGIRPLDELEIALARVAADQAGNLREHLDRDEYGLLRIASLILPNDGSELVLIVDQFEEVFTLVDDEAIRGQFLDLIHAAVTDPRSRVRVVVTLRADFYDRPLHYPAFGELVRERMETILPLSANELEAAVTKPAERVGVTFEEGLVSTITAEVNYQPGALPLLQYALTELFDGREGRILTQAAYQAQGGAIGALAHRADELYLEQDELGQETIRQMFLRLVTLGEGTEDTRRRVRRSELLGITSREDVMDEVIDTYAAYRLLSLDHDPLTRSPTVEVAHEALLIEWERLREWLNTNREEIRLQRQLATAVAAWYEADQDTSYLLHGSRLEQLEVWAAETELALTQREQTYLDASLAERERQMTIEQERQAREARLEHRARRVLQGLVVVFLVAAVISVGLALFAFDERDKAQVAHEIAQEERGSAQHLALVNRAQLALVNDDLISAATLALEANRGESSSSQAQQVLADVAYQPGVMAEFEIADVMSPIEFSPDGKTVLLASGGSKLAVWYDLATGETLQVFDEPVDTYYAIFSPDGTLALITGKTGPPTLWNLTSGTLIHRLEGHAGAVLCADFSPDGTQVLTSGGQELESPYNLILWDVATGEMIRTFDGHTQGGVWGLDFSPDGTRFLSGGEYDFQIFEWDVATGEIIRTIGTEDEAHTDSVTNVHYSPDGTRAVSGSTDGTMRLWDLATNTLIDSFPIAKNGSLAVSPDGRTALTRAETDSRLVVWWNLETGQEIQILPHVLNVVGFAFSPDGRKVASTSSYWTQSLQLWDLSIDQRLRQIPLGSLPTDPELMAWFMRISPDEQTALIGTVRRNATEGPPCPLILVDMQTGQEIHRFEAPVELDNCMANGMAFSPDGRLVIEAKRGGLVIFWDVDQASPTFGEALHVRDDHGTGALGTVFSADGRMALTGGGGAAIVWDVESAEVIHRFEGILGVGLGAFSSDGHTVVIGGKEQLILFDLATGEEIWRREDLIGWVLKPEFTPDGEMIMVSDEEGDLKFFDVGTGKLIQHWRDNGIQSEYRYFSPEGRYVFTLTPEEITQWDLTRGEAIRHYPASKWGHGGEFALSADGKSFYVLDVEGGMLDQWRIDTHAELVAWVEANRYARELTCKEREDYGIEPRCE